MSTSAISIWLPRIRLLIAVMVGICFVVALVAALGQLRDHPIDFSKLKWSRFGVAVLLYIAALSAGGVYWHYVLGVMGQRIDFLSALRIFYISQLGKYVPGKAMVVLIRATELQRRGVPFKIAVTSVFVETLTWIAVGAVCGALAIVCWVPDHVWLVGLASCVAVAAVIPNLPPVLRALLKWMKFEPCSVDRFRVMDVVYGWGVFAVGWALKRTEFVDSVERISVCRIGWCGCCWEANGDVVPMIQAGDFVICLAAVTLGKCAGIRFIVAWWDWCSRVGDAAFARHTIRVRGSDRGGLGVALDLDVQ